VTALWTTGELPGAAFDPEPDDDGDDGPWCRAPGLLPEQRDRTATVQPPEEYL
jgi:hypothetical protein